MGRTKRQLARELAQELRLPERTVLRLIGRLFRKISEDLARTGRVELRGFGTFNTAVRPAQSLRSPKTGEPVQVPAYRAVVFRSGKLLRERLEKKTEQPARVEGAGRLRRGGGRGTADEGDRRRDLSETGDPGEDRPEVSP